MSTLINLPVPLFSITNDKTKMRNKNKWHAKHMLTPSAWKNYRNYLDTYCCALDSAKDKHFSHYLPLLLKSKKVLASDIPYHDNNPLSLHGNNHIPLSDNECLSVVFNSNLPHFPDYASGTSLRARSGDHVVKRPPHSSAAVLPNCKRLEPVFAG